MRTQHLFSAVLLLTITLITGCEVTQSETVRVQPVPPAQAYNLASVRGMVPGEWFHFDLAGYDSNGDPWHGSVTKSGLAQRWVEGTWTTPTLTEMTLTHEPSGSSVYRSMTLYLDGYGQEVRLDLDSGVVCYPQLTNDIPAYAYAGDYGDLGIMLCSDGTELHGIWDLYQNRDNSADFVTLSTFWYGSDALSSTEVTQTLAPDGLIIGYAISLYLPDYGVTLWMDSL